MGKREELLKEVAESMIATMVLAAKSHKVATGTDVDEAMPAHFECGFVAGLAASQAFGEDEIDKILKYHQLKKDEIKNNIEHCGCACGECNKKEDESTK